MSSAFSESLLLRISLTCATSDCFSEKHFLSSRTVWLASDLILLIVSFNEVTSTCRSAWLAIISSSDRELAVPVSPWERFR